MAQEHYPVIKDPQAVLNYGFDWTTKGWLGTDTITASTWTITPGLAIDSHTHDTTSTTVWLSGGTAGTTYSATNHITTAGGRQDDRTLTIKVEQR